MSDVLIQGNTYAVREQLKAMGGRWDAALKGWWVPAEKEGDARALLPMGRGLPRGQLWQPCFCGEEPVCARCERCETHCFC